MSSVCEDMYQSFGIKYDPNTYTNYNEVRIKIPSRFLVIGSSSSGKTNLVLALIKKMACFNKIWLVAKNTEEPLYESFINEIQKQEEQLRAMKSQKKYKNYQIDDAILTVLNDPLELPSPEEFNKDDNNLIIFDDLMCESRKVKDYCTQYYARGRKKQCTVFFLSQSIVGCSKDIRRNCNIIIIKDVPSNSDIETLAKEYSIGISQEKLKHAIQTCTKDRLSCLLLDKDNPDPRYRIRKYLEPLNI